MTEPEPYDSTFDLGGLPGGDILFTDPTATSAAEPVPTMAVPPPGAQVYRPDPPTAGRPVAPTPPTPPTSTRSARPTTPTPPAQWPRPDSPAPTSGQRPPGGTSRPGRSRSLQSRPAQRRGQGSKVKRAWPLIGLLLWLGGHAASAHHDSPDSGSAFSVSAPADSDPVASTDLSELGPSVKVGDMHYGTTTKVQDGDTVEVTIVPPTGALYTLTQDADPVGATGTYYTAALSDADLDRTHELQLTADGSQGKVTCQVRDDGVLIAVGQGDGSLNCLYDPHYLKN